MAASNPASIMQSTTTTSGPKACASATMSSLAPAPTRAGASRSAMASSKASPAGHGGTDG
jgi:hypothetical protein